MTDDMAERYEAQMQTMWERARQWRSENPTRIAEVVYHIPAHAVVIAPISEAVKMGIVTTNEAGLELLKYLWTWDDASEPTVLMTRVVLDNSDSRRR